MWWWWWCNDTPVTDSSYSRHICPPNPADALKKKKKERKKEIITTKGFGDEKQMEQKQKGEGSRRPISARPALPSLPWMGEGSLVGKEKTSLPIHALDSSSGKIQTSVLTDAVKPSSRTMSTFTLNKGRNLSAPHELACLSTQKQFSSSLLIHKPQYIPGSCKVRS